MAQNGSMEAAERKMRRWDIGYAAFTVRWLYSHGSEQSFVVSVCGTLQPYAADVYSLKGHLLTAN